MKLESGFSNFGQIPCIWAESMWVDTLYVHTLDGSKLKSTLCQILVMHMRIELSLSIATFFTLNLGSLSGSVRTSHIASTCGLLQCHGLEGASNV